MLEKRIYISFATFLIIFIIYLDYYFHIESKYSSAGNLEFFKAHLPGCLILLFLFILNLNLNYTLALREKCTAALCFKHLLLLLTLPRPLPRTRTPKGADLQS